VKWYVTTKLLNITQYALTNWEGEVNFPFFKTSNQMESHFTPIIYDLSVCNTHSFTDSILYLELNITSKTTNDYLSFTIAIPYMEKFQLLYITLLLWNFSSKLFTVVTSYLIYITYTQDTLITYCFHIYLLHILLVYSMTLHT